MNEVKSVSMAREALENYWDAPMDVLRKDVSITVNLASALAALLRFVEER